MEIKTHLRQKVKKLNILEVLCESGKENFNKSVNMPVKILKQRPNEDLNRAKKQPSLFLIQC